MIHFKERYSDVVAKDIPFRVMRPGRRTLVEYHRSSDVEEASKLVGTLVGCVNDEDTGSHQKCAYYCSIITCFFPDLFPFCKAALSDAGMDLHLLTTAGQREEAWFELGESNDLAYNLVLFGQAVLLLFKDISAASYANYMTDCISAMRAHAGVDKRKEMEIAFGEEPASIIRIMLGTKRILRIALLDYLIEVAKMGDTLGNVCSYLTFMLSWTGMATLVTINDTLLVSHSPVIRDPRIQSEAKALADAYRVINRYKSPQFFGIIATLQEARCMERSKFPILFAVAQTIRKDQLMTTVRRFLTATNIANDIVRSLVEVHRRYMLIGNEGTLKNIAFLQAQEEHEEENED